jgi:translation initiation factor IF-1
MSGSNIKKFDGKDDLIETEGVVVEVLPQTKFKIKLLKYNQIITAHLSGRLSQHNIKVIIGDRVRIEMSTYDLTKGRIIWRDKDKVDAESSAPKRRK